MKNLLKLSCFVPNPTLRLLNRRMGIDMALSILRQINVASFLRKAIWCTGLSAYVLFAFWYTNTKGAVTDAETTQWMETLASRDLDSDQLWRLRQFMEQDIGEQFIMVNVLDLAEEPPNMPATPPGADANKLLEHYMEHIYPELLKRASHPVFFGQAVHRAIDLLGVANVDQTIDMGSWNQAALMRYRSRRDLMAVIAEPRFLERHDYKLAALTKTITYPVKPSFYLSDLRVLAGLLIFTFLLLLDWLFFRRRPTLNERD